MLQSKKMFLLPCILSILNKIKKRGFSAVIKATSKCKGDLMPYTKSLLNTRRARDPNDEGVFMAR